VIFSFPDNCITEASRGPFCLRYQERQHELCIGKMITEAERAANVWAMLPFLHQAREDAQRGNYNTGMAPWVAAQADWDGKEIKQPPGLNPDHKGAVWSHTERVFALNIDSPDINAISHEVAKAREVCLHDPHWNEDIDLMWLDGGM